MLHIETEEGVRNIHQVHIAAAMTAHIDRNELSKTIQEKNPMSRFVLSTRFDQVVDAKTDGALPLLPLQCDMCICACI